MANSLDALEDILARTGGIGVLMTETPVKSRYIDFTILTIPFSEEMFYHLLEFNGIEKNTIRTRYHHR